MISAMRHEPTHEPDSRRIRRARSGVMGLFLSTGVLLATFLSRLPSIRDELGVDKGQLSTLLAVGAGGALVALVLTGWAAAKFGTRPLIVWSTLGYTVAFVGLGVSASLGMPVLFAVSQFLVSFSFAFANVSMNAEAAATERLVGRKIMPHFHAAFSIGMALGLAIGWGFSKFNIAPLAHLAVMALILMVVRLALVPIAIIDGRPIEYPAGTRLGGPFATAKKEYRDPRVLMIGAIIFAASMTEGAAAQWIAIAGVDDFGRAESTGDFMYWIFVVAMVTVRSLGARLLDRFGRVAMLRASALSVIVGIVMFALTPWFALVPVALVFWGVGSALGVPIGFTAAAEEPKRAAARVAAVSSFATIAGLAIPPAIGHLAEATSTRHALLIVVLAAIASFALARSVRREEQLFGRLRRRLRRPQLEAAATALSVAPSDTGTTLGA